MISREAAVLVLCAVLGGCGQTPAPAGGDAGPVGSRRGGEVPEAGAPAALASADSPKVQIQESEWTESERSRDPFRSFATVFVEEARSRVKSQREVVLEDFAIDELRLVGIVLGSDPPVAMLVDPTGKGHTIHRGQFVGRPDLVQGGNRGATYEVNWRVDRIRDGDVVFIREDPQNPDVPSATKVIALRTDGQGSGS
jgi:type IV pilus assembly protein PilP